MYMVLGKYLGSQSNTNFIAQLETRKQ
jgi:hypothetical protein